LPGDPSVAGLLRKISELVGAGVDWIQVREKDLPAKDLGVLAKDALNIAGCSSAGPRILINDRLDVAIALRAGGVHLGNSSVPILETKRLIAVAQSKGKLARDFVAGVSCHSMGEALAAQRDGADYIFFGPIFQTPSKAEFGPPQGIERLAEICRKITIPVWAIGGITGETIAACLRAGAVGAAAIRLFQDTPDPRRLVTSIRGEKCL
jgi:thiamine-phosphate pyrophosphorylase